MNGKVVQLGVSFILTILTSMVSFSVVWPSYSLEILKSDESPFGYKISSLEGNLIGSIPMIGSLLSTLPAGFISEALGRKRCHILCGLLFTVSWSLTVTAKSIIQILAARVLMGIAGGMAIVNVMCFISEITELKIRGSAISCISLMYNLGIMASYLIGWFCSFEVICYVCVSESVLFVLGMSLMKETPVWLLKNGREKEALASLKLYRGVTSTTDAILQEIAELKRQQGGKDTDLEDSKVSSENDKLCEEKDTPETNVENKSPWILLFTVDYNRRALVSIVMQLVLTVFMGMVAVQTYAGSLFKTAAPDLSSNLCSVLLAVVLVSSSIPTMIVSDLLPRRVLMLITLVISTICLALIGSMLQWSWGPSWISPLLILVYIMSFHIGCINIPFIQMGESFGPQVNSAASAIILCFMFIANFVLLFLFMPVVGLFGLDGAFYIFAAIGAITTIVTFFITKETRRTPLEKVQKMYARGYLYRKSDLAL